MFVFRVAALATILGGVCAVCFAQVPENVYTQDIDRSIKPGDDFYQYANGGWIKANQGRGRAVYDSRTIVNEKTSQRVRDLVQGAALAKAVKGSVTQKVGDYYASFMDVNAIEAKGMLPLAHEMAAIGGTVSSVISNLGLTAMARCRKRAAAS